jgi:hypothetical protein
MSKFGYIRDTYDDRDYLMRAYLPVIKAPKKVDYSRSMSPVRDQGDEGTCVGFAVTAGMKEYQELLDYSKLVLLSPRFLYSECKKLDGMPEAEGTSLRIAMKVLKEKGVCREKFWPYSPHQRDRFRNGAQPDAKKFRVITYARILNLNELLINLASKGPCVMGVEVFKGMMNTKTGIVTMPAGGETPIGGHAICAAGYDDNTKLIKFKNSWSDDWGSNGYGFLPYAYIEKYMMDAWSSVDFEDPNPIQLGSKGQGKRKPLRTG